MFISSRPSNCGTLGPVRPAREPVVGRAPEKLACVSCLKHTEQNSDGHIIRRHVRRLALPLTGPVACLPALISPRSRVGPVPGVHKQ
jgi:hypothetical protein